MIQSQTEVEKVEKETRMDALKSGFRPDAVAQRQSHGSSSEETAWVVVEKGENFSVDELFNLGEFGNNEQGAEEDEEDVKKTEAAKRTETENNSSVAAAASSLPSSSGSALSFEAPLPLPMPLSLSEMSLPAHVAEELEWVSFIIDDSASEFPAGVAPFSMLPQVQTKSHDSAQRETRHQQPHAAAVAATQGAFLPCSTVHALSTQAPVPARAKRSKRSRTVPVCWSSLRFADSCSTTTTSMTTSSASSCSSASSSLSCLIYDHPVTTSDQNFLHVRHPSPPLPPPPQSKNQKVPKKRGRRPKPYADGGASRPSGERRCSHCGVQKTPQWRAGPMGAKTLCNACGVRFKSGRLLPEYRPACSPTFQNSIHSNSHRKVLEMRRKKEILAAAGPPIASC